MFKIKSKRDTINSLVASFESAEAIEEAINMDECDADTNVVNQDIAAGEAEVLSIENHIELAMNLADDDATLADYAEARAGDEEEVSMESFVVLLNDYNNRSKYISKALTDGTISLEAAEEFDAGDKEGKKEKLKNLATAAGGRARTLVLSIINAIKAMVDELKNIAASLFDKSLKLTKQATELKKAVSDDVTKSGDVPASRSAKALMVHGEFDPRAFKTIAEINDFSKEYVEKLAHSIVNHDYKTGEPPFAFYKVVRENLSLKDKWVKLGEQDIYIGEMPGGVVVTRAVEKIGDGESAVEVDSYKMEKTESENETAKDNIKLMSKSQRYDMIDIALEIAEAVTSAKSQYKTVDDAMKEIKSFLDETYKKLNEESEEKYDVNADIKSIKTLMTNLKTFSTSFQKYSLNKVEDILNVVREHDKVAAAGAKEEAPAAE